MNSLIENLNQLGGQLGQFAWPMLWQSSLLIAFVFALDFLLGQKIRASVRYALWLAVLVKLLLPPTLALPTGAAWWLFRAPPAVKAPAIRNYTVTYDTTPLADYVPPSIGLPPPAPPKLDGAGWGLIATGTVSAALLLWLMIRWWQVARMVRGATVSEELAGLSEAVRQQAGWRYRIRLKLVEGRMSPSVCGLFRPVILLPRTLAENLSAAQLRAVLLHEVFHLRRLDVWVNCAQALLQIVYWWHPLLWFANARIRRLREEAVDDAVMLALRDEADSYAPTLLEVAKLAFRRPLLSLGLVGIMESRSALRQRIERLVDFRAPRRAGLTFASLCGICVFSAVALPMGEAPSLTGKSNALGTAATAEQSLAIKVNTEIFYRNLKAQSAKAMQPPTNYSGNILDVFLSELLRDEGVDCHPPHGLIFTYIDGYVTPITTKSTPEQLEIFGRVIEQLNRADGKCELPLGNNPLRKNVLIEGRFYPMSDGEFGQFTAGLHHYSGGSSSAEWWSVPPEQFKQFVNSIEASGLQPIQRPRIQTGSGIAATLYVGNQTNSLELACKPHVGEGFVDLALESTVISGAPVNAFTNHVISQASAEDHGGIVLRMANYGGHPGSNLVTVISAEIVTNPPAHFQQRLVAVIKRAGDTNSVVQPTNGVFSANGKTIGIVNAGVMADSDFVAATRAFLNFSTSFPTSFHPAATGVADAAATNAVPPLYSRSFQVDPRTFLADLKRTGVVSDGVTDEAVLVQKFFESLGVDLESPPGKSVFYGDKLGKLFVKATESNLDTIGRGLSALNQVAPQIHIKARFIEVPKGTLDGLKNVIAVTNLPALPNQVAGLVGILTDKNFRTVLHTLEARSDVENLAEPEVVTTSGRQTQMRATQTTVTIITNFVFEEFPTNQNGSVGSVTAKTGPLETGPVFDVVPYVLSDGYTLDLQMTTSSMEFYGYVDIPTNLPPLTVTTSTGETVNPPQVWPAVLRYQKSAHVNLFDGQIVILALTNPEQVQFGEPDEKREAAVAKHIRDAVSHNGGRNEILVFVTATIVDPAGNRVHSDDELPFAHDGIPPQPQPTK